MWIPSDKTHWVSQKLTTFPKWGECILYPGVYACIKPAYSPNRSFEAKENIPSSQRQKEYVIPFSFTPGTTSYSTVCIREYMPPCRESPIKEEEVQACERFLFAGSKGSWWLNWKWGRILTVITCKQDIKSMQEYGWSTFHYPQVSSDEESEAIERNTSMVSYDNLTLKILFVEYWIL